MVETQNAQEWNGMKPEVIDAQYRCGHWTQWLEISINWNKMPSHHPTDNQENKKDVGMACQKVCKQGRDDIK